MVARNLLPRPTSLVQPEVSRIRTFAAIGPTYLARAARPSIAHDCNF